MHRLPPALRSTAANGVAGVLLPPHTQARRRGSPVRAGGGIDTLHMHDDAKQKLVEEVQRKRLRPVRQ